MTPPAAVTLAAVADFLSEFFRTDRYPRETNGSVLPSERPLGRLGLALEPSPELASWAESQRLDALLLRRAAKLDVGALPEGCLSLGAGPPYWRTGVRTDVPHADAFCYNLAIMTE